MPIVPSSIWIKRPRQTMPETRITAGEWRGRVIGTSRGQALRPTRSLVREALFNIVGAEVEGARMLDIYAGAGAVGFEALSRGAAHVTFIDRQRSAADLIAATVARFGCAERCDLVVADAVAWLRGRGQQCLKSIDICFLDAPYQDDSVVNSLALLGGSPPPLVVCEHHRDRKIAERIGRLERVRQARYGLTTLSFLRPHKGDGTQ